MEGQEDATEGPRESTAAAAAAAARTARAERICHVASSSSAAAQEPTAKSPPVTVLRLRLRSGTWSSNSARKVRLSAPPRCWKLA